VMAITAVTAIAILLTIVVPPLIVRARSVAHSRQDNQITYASVSDA
jgi:hypothetical protein